MPEWVDPVVFWKSVSLILILSLLMTGFMFHTATRRIKRLQERLDSTQTSGTGDQSNPDQLRQAEGVAP